ncbi:MAG TPA: hypothetical protein VFF02_17030, partial [Anaeromyxobacteraceae bacterium]|nr:hypothetical protein [Anaeromyxobacteraceae bacterium]
DHLAAGRRGLDGIRDQVDEGLLEAARVRLDDRASPGRPLEERWKMRDKTKAVRARGDHRRRKGSAAPPYSTTLALLGLLDLLKGG